ncbi:MAG: hypothetical protein IKP64_14550, partial [Selenomonadaceae bacterium]|nr:hypothetical protein [Selenomonadaceae bacterium]
NFSTKFTEEFFKPLINPAVLLAILKKFFAARRFVELTPALKEILLPRRRKTAKYFLRRG